MTTDGTTDPKDTSAEKQDASKGKQETSKETPDTFTEKTQAKAVSDALATAGRTAKALEKRETALQGGLQVLKDAETKSEAKQREKDEAELEAAEGNKDETSHIKRRQALRVGEFALKEKVAEHEKTVALHQTELDATKATKFEADVFELAKEQGVDASWLKELGITDIEQLKTIAKGVSNKEATGPDPGGTKGGGEVTEQQRLDKLYPTTAKKS